MPRIVKTRKLTLWLYDPHEMAEIKEGNFCLFLGNYWDFHSNCHGPIIEFKNGERIDFNEEWTEDIRDPWSVINMIANKIEAIVDVKLRKTPFDC